MKQKDNTNTKQGHSANMLLYAVAPQPKLSTDSNALDSVSELRGITVGADSKPIQMFNEDCLEGIKRIPDNSIDAIVTDPPYLYLKCQKLEREFDEQLFFSECKRVLKKDGFIVLFGRGISFYRWNMILFNLGFSFKEEIVWDKVQNSSPVTPINRVHELITIYGGSPIKPTFVPYVEMKTNPDEIVRDINRIKVAINNRFEFDDLIKYLESDEVRFRPEERTLGKNTTVQTRMSQQSRVVKAMQSIKRGHKEKSIIKVLRDHFNTIHPTQKPVRLLERLINMVSNEGDTILDPFAGSFSCAEACNKSLRKFIGFEIDKEYFDAGKKRLSNLQITLINK